MRTLLKLPPIADKNVTLNSQAPYTEGLFSLWLWLSVAAGSRTAI